MKLHSSHREAMRTAAITVAGLAAVVLLARVLPELPGTRGIAGYLPLHMLLETFSIVVAMLIFAVGWHTRHRDLPGNIVLLACAFFAVGLLDFEHMLSYAGMPDFVTPSGAEKGLNFWLAARFAAAAALLVAVAMPWRPFTSAATRYSFFAAALAATAFASWLFIFHPEAMPRTFIPGQGLTAFKLASEYFFIALNLVTALMLWRQMRGPLPFNAAALFGAVCAMALSEYFFTLYAGMTDIYNLFGHVYKAVSYLFLYRAIFVTTVEIPYRQLQSSETRLRTLFESTGDAVMLLDEKGFFDCNKAALAMFGCASKEGFCAKHPADLSPPAQPGGTDSMTLANERIATAMEQGSNFFEWTHRRAGNGKDFPAEVLLDSMVLDGKKVLQATVRDITERKNIKQALMESEEKFRRLFEDVADPVLLLKDGRFVGCNAATLKLLGYGSKEEFLNRSPPEISPLYQPDGRASAEKSVEMDAIALREGFNRFEWLHTRADGSTVPVEVTLTSIIVKGERILHVLWRDITERKKNEAQIERLSCAYRLLSRVNETIVRAQNKNWLFAAICDAAMESALFRFIWIGMLDEQRLAVIPAAYAGAEDGFLGNVRIRLDDERTGKAPICTALRTNNFTVCQDIEDCAIMAGLPWRDEAIKRGYRAFAAFPICEEGVAAGAINVYSAEENFFTPDIIQLMLELSADVSFALDVFAEKQRRELAEGEIRRMNTDLEHRVQERTRQLEAANKELEAFSYSVSHDLRAPLRSIDGFSRTLSRKYHDQLDATGRDWLERVCRASQHMGHLIDDMLKLSQVTRSPLKRERVDLSKIAENVMDDLRKAHPGRQVRFTLQQDLIAHADAGLMRIVMDNLLGNAWKYSGKKAEAEIGFGVCGINPDNLSGVDPSSDLGEKRVFFVRDNGAGFNMDYAHKLFGAFQRLHGTSEFDGTGIGLATVQRIIHRHHGEVWAEAEEGQGATFYFMLPQKTL